MANKIEYSNEDITIVWQPKICQHSAICVKSLPKVYKPNEKPWISIGNANTDELKKQISNCPSKALTFYKKENK